jgi:hypothetical protein
MITGRVAALSDLKSNAPAPAATHAWDCNLTGLKVALAGTARSDDDDRLASVD